MTARRRRTAGARIVTLVVVVVAVALALTVLVLRQLMLRDLDARIDRSLVQETMELNEFVASNGPAEGETSEAFARRMLTSYLETNVTDAGESLIAVQNGEAFLQSRQAPADLTSLVARFDGLTEPQFTDETSAAGGVRILVQPLIVDGRQAGALVVSSFVDAEYRRVDSTIREAAAVALAALLVSSGLAWFVVRRMMRPVGLLAGMARDITEHDLSKRLPVQGTDEIASLIESFNRMLDRLEQALDSQRQFLDDAGHELRTPLTVVRGHLELADDPEKLAASRDVLVGEVDRMSRLVEDLILLAKSEEFDFLRHEPVDVDDFMRDLLPRLERIGPQQWQLVSTQPGIVSADPERLTQAMLNLAANAARHSEDDSTIAVGAAFERDGLSLWVRDNGEGIAHDDLERIFERFGRARNQQRPGGRAGLGLAIVEAIADAHGGRVEVTSRLGAGSTFTIWIPMEPLPETEDAFDQTVTAELEPATDGFGGDTDPAGSRLASGPTGDTSELPAVPGTGSGEGSARTWVGS